MEGGIQEADIIAALRLYITREKFSFPATHQGLGYNNLIYISLMLASMSFRASQRRGQNAAIFPMLLIEEPEAHLHPALQYKLLSHIVSRVEDEPNDSRQVFVTTHSTHVTSAVKLNSIIGLSLNCDGTIGVSYPGKLFPQTEKGQVSRGYVERYLDATKSTMLFAKGVLLVEGIAEQLIVPALAHALGMPFDHHHVAIVRVDGLTFKHFLYLFGAGSAEGMEEFALNCPVACLVDADPTRKEKGVKNARWKSCFPFELGHDDSSYDYRDLSGVVANLNSLKKNRVNIGIFHGEKTLEYDLAMWNYKCQEFVTTVIKHADEIRQLAIKPMALSGKLKEMLNDDEYEALEKITSENKQKQHRFAAAYLRCAEKCKGEHAFALEQLLRLEKNASIVKCPSYIQQAIKWVTKFVPAKERTS